MSRENETQSDQSELLTGLRDIANKYGLDITTELKAITEKLQASSAIAQVWRKIELARHNDRPRALDYIDMIFDYFIELHGDRCFGDDPALIGGIAFIKGIPVTVIGNQKGRNLRETIDRNGGMANPEGYRKAPSSPLLTHRAPIRDLALKSAALPKLLRLTYANSAVLKHPLSAL